jgi:hypothetical protein
MTSPVPRRAYVVAAALAAAKLAVHLVVLLLRRLPR